MVGLHFCVPTPLNHGHGVSGGVPPQPTASGLHLDAEYHDVVPCKSKAKLGLDLEPAKRGEVTPIGHAEKPAR